jgi:GNAT superfamily N-acetyltransferase
MEIELLDKLRHDIKHFKCGKIVMNDFLSRYADKNSKLGLSRTWVLARDVGEEKKSIISYFTLSVMSIESQVLPDPVKLPRYPTPVTLLARIAVDLKYQKEGLGSKTLVAALKQALLICDNGLPTFAVILDILDDDALKFYEKFNFFKPLDEKNKRLFVPMYAIRKLFGAF